jgi:hypothetical protein
MALPLNNAPVYNLVVPSTKQTIKYRPFLVKDQKALMLAQQSEDQKVMVDTLKTVIKSCVSDPIDVDNLAMFDLEYIFTQLRAKSVGETVELIMSCDEDHGDENKLAKVKMAIDLTKLEVEAAPDHTNKIPMWGDVGVVMKYPSVDIIKKFETIGNNDTENVFNIITQSIDYIYDGEEVYHAKEQTKDELLQFVNNLTTEQFQKIQQFFETMPKLRYDVKYNCPVCSKAHLVRLEGMDSFF